LQLEAFCVNKKRLPHTYQRMRCKDKQSTIRHFNENSESYFIAQMHRHDNLGYQEIRALDYNNNIIINKQILI